MNEIEKLNGVCYLLINQCIETNAETLTITQKGVTRFGKKLGDWEIIVRKKKGKK